MPILTSDILISELLQFEWLPYTTDRVSTQAETLDRLSIAARFPEWDLHSVFRAYVLRDGGKWTWT